MPMTFTCRAVLFDLDGTLIDSGSRIRRLWQWWAESRGIDYQSLLGIILGRTAVETIRMAAPHLDAEAEMKALEAEEVSDMRDVYIYPGTLELVKRLDGAPWAIVTSGSERVANGRIGHVGLPPPPVLITANDIRNGKPAPDAYLLAAERLGVQPQDCVVIEDAPVGVEGGKRAGMRVIAVATTNSAEALRDADAVVSSLASLVLEVGPTGIQLKVPSL